MRGKRVIEEVPKNPAMNHEEEQQSPSVNQEMEPATKGELKEIASKLETLFQILGKSPFLAGTKQDGEPDQNLHKMQKKEIANAEKSRATVSIRSEASVSGRRKELKDKKPVEEGMAESEPFLDPKRKREKSPVSHVLKKKKSESIPDSPFTKKILEAPVPKFRGNALEFYCGKTDPSSFIAMFEDQMLLYTFSDEAKCKILLTILRDSARTWFSRLENGSITSFAKFKKLLISNFSSSKVPKLSNKSLLSFEQSENESLREYVTRFNAARLEVADGDESIVRLAFEEGLREGPFKYFLSMNPQSTLSKMLAIAQKHMEADDAIIRGKRLKEKMLTKVETPQVNVENVRSNIVKPDQGYKGRGGRPPVSVGRSNYNSKAEPQGDDIQRSKSYEQYCTPLNRPLESVMATIQNEKFFHWPKPLRGTPEGRDNTKYCKYHNDIGHTTEVCRHLRMLIEDLISKGYLSEFIKTTDPVGPSQLTQQQQFQQRNNLTSTSKQILPSNTADVNAITEVKGIKSNLAGLINVIFGGAGLDSRRSDSGGSTFPGDEEKQEGMRRLTSSH